MANPSADLLRAIKSNDIAAAHIAIRAGADPDPQSAGGEWPLDLAVSKRSYELMDALIAAEFPFQLRGCQMQSLVIFSESELPFPQAAPKRLNQIFQDIRQPGQDCPIIIWQQSGPFARIDWDWENL